MIRGQDVPRPSTLYCRKAPSRHALSFPLLLFFGLTRFVNVQCCAPLDHACSFAFIVCVCVCVCVCVGDFTAPVSDWVCGGLSRSESSARQPATPATDT